MSIRELISGETIELCNHHQGQPIGIDDQGIHIDKRYNRGSSKKGKVKAVIYLDGREVEVKGEEGRDVKSIISELKKTFKKKNIRERFVKSVRDTLEKLAIYSQYLDQYSIVDPATNRRVLNSEGIDRINEMLENLVSSFGYSRDDIKSILFTSSSTIVSTYQLTKHSNNAASMVGPNSPELSLSGTPYKKSLYIRSDLGKPSITITRNRDMLDDNDKS